MTEGLIKPTNYLQKKQNTNLLGKLKNSGKCILVDISGSMSEYTLQGKTKHRIVQETLGNFPRNTTLYEFSNECKRVNGDLSAPKGGTRMADAFDTVKHDKYNECILLTDGMPDDEVAAIRSSLNLKLHIVYIGDEPIPEFLKKLGGLTGNSFGNVNLNLLGGQLELENKIKGLLG